MPLYEVVPDIETLSPTANPCDADVKSTKEPAEVDEAVILPFKFPSPWNVSYFSEVLSPDDDVISSAYIAILLSSLYHAK